MHGSATLVHKPAICSKQVSYSILFYSGPKSVILINMKFTELSRPFIIGVISDNDILHCVQTIKQSEFAGADGFQLELHNLQSSPPTKQELKDIIGSTIKPVWTTNRRSKADRQQRRKVDEHARIQVELDALDAGAQCIDLEMDTFDPWFLWDSDRRATEWPHLKDIPVNANDFPGECCFNDDAIREQRKIIDHVHNAGAEVLLSCHILVRTRTEGIIRIAKELEQRGADLIKIVVWNDDFYDLCETLRANVALSEMLDTPFKVMSQGEPSKLGRALFPMFGSAWAFCQLDLRPGGFHYRPLIATEKYLLQHLDWQPNWMQHAKLVAQRQM